MELDAGGNILIKKSIVTTMILLFLIMSILSTEDIYNQNSIEIEVSIMPPSQDISILPLYTEAIDVDCYGFVVPLPSGEDSTYETFQNSKVRHLINDLLRENVSVYWSSCHFSAMSKEMNNESDVVERCYKKGDFIIPFSGDLCNDVLTTAIIYDYNKTSEIEDDDFLKTEVYKLMNPVSIDAYKLVEPKIVQHLGTPTRYGWPIYLHVAEAGGFLTMEFLLDDETAKYLNNNDFNVFMWPYNPNPGTTFEVVKSLTNKDGSNAIRKFVRDGGGYIGSCYGAQAASSGYIAPIPFFSLRYAYNSDLSFTIPFISFSISDTLMRLKRVNNYELYIATSEIEDTDHPLAYGINKTVKEFFNGPLFLWLGSNSAKVATFTGLQSEKNSSVDPIFQRKVIGAPSWVYSTFGDGKIVLFSSHPELVNNISLLLERFEWEDDPYYGRRTIHNALFYVTSENLKETEITNEYPVSFIEEMGEKTIDLYLPPNNESAFDSIKTRLTVLNENLSILRNISVEHIELFSELFNENLIFKGDILYPVTYVFYYCTFFSDYNNKTLSDINKLDQTYPLLVEYNDSVRQLVDRLKSDMSSRLNHSEKLISDIITLANNLKDDLQTKRNIFQKLKILTDARYMLRTFEIGLKYIPQTHFQTLKLVRYCWYNYEAYKTIATE